MDGCAAGPAYRPRRRSPSSTCATPWACAALDDVAVLDEVAPLGRTDADGRVVLRAAGRRWQATLRIAPGRPRRQSCADPAAKEVPVLTVVGLEPAPG